MDTIEVIRQVEARLSDIVEAIQQVEARLSDTMQAIQRVDTACPDIAEAIQRVEARLSDQPSVVIPAVGTVIRSYLPSAVLRSKIASRSFWHHQIELAPGITAPGMNDCRATLQHLELPANMAGMRVLDLGAAEGYFTFECEGRGASELIAIDYNPPEHTGFTMCAELFGSKARHVLDSLYNLRPQRYGHFDVILFLGILYHLPDPLLALHIVRDLCRPSALVLIETHITDTVLVEPDGTRLPLTEDMQRVLQRVPMMQFYANNSLNRDDVTNFWGPNIACMFALLGEAGFEVLSHSRPMPHRAVFNCRLMAPSDRSRLIHHAYGNLSSAGTP